MTLRRLGRVTRDPLDTTDRTMTTLPWADATRPALQRDRDEQPTAGQLARATAYTATPREYIGNPHLRLHALADEYSRSFQTFWAALEQTLDTGTACRVARAAGRIHGARRLGTYLAGIGSSGGPEAMAAWQDTAHSSQGRQFLSALFARFDDELVEVVRTDGSFGTSEHGAPVSSAFFDGFIEGYQSVDPSLSGLESLARETPGGHVEFVHRFWFRQADGSPATG